MADTLKQRIIRHIRMSGPLPLAEYMHWCMADRQQGYYQARTPIGNKGDFITAPEVSQMFGELIGIWAIEAWKALGSPERINLVELGPGRGTLMKDLLRATGISKEFSKAAHITLIETSEALRKVQAETLEGCEVINWLEQIDNLSGNPTLIIANEFLDVLPFRQYVKSGGKWHENLITVDDDENLAWVLGAGLIDHTSLPQYHDQEPDSSVFEIATAREAFISKLSEHIAEHTGAALFIDYGHTCSGFGDTFQAIRNHQYDDPLKEPGRTDLTSHVDFEALSRAIGSNSVHIHPFMTQGEFLLSLGLLERAGQLGSGKNADTQVKITREVERLASPEEMGELFKVFSFSTCKDLFPFTNRA